MLTKLSLISVLTLGSIATTPGTSSADPWDQVIHTSQVAGQDGVSRFTLVMAEGWNIEAMRDDETGLVWELQPSARGFRWDDARSHCLNLKKGGRKGWRMPSINELSSLIDTKERDPALPSGLNFGLVTLNSHYFSATRSEDYFYGGPSRYTYEVSVNKFGEGDVRAKPAARLSDSSQYRLTKVWTLNFRHGQVTQQIVRHKFGYGGIADSIISGKVWCVRGGASPTML